MNRVPTIVAAVTFLRPGDGGRTAPPVDSPHYRPHLVVGDPAQRTAVVDAGNVIRETYIGVHFAGDGSTMPVGSELVVTLALTYFPHVDYSALVAGATFTIREGPKVVGFGKVLRFEDLVVTREIFQNKESAAAPLLKASEATLDELIEIACVQVPRMSEVASAARVLGISVGGVCDQVSRTVVERFVQGTYSFTVADVVMSNLFAFAHGVSGEGLPALSWSVYLAFDAGEDELPGEPPELQGEQRTRVLLAQIPSLGLPPAPPENPAWRLAHRASARAQAVYIAKQVLGGQRSPVTGAQELIKLKPSLGVAAEDADFQAFNLIDLESLGLPIGPVTQHWAPEALATKAAEIHRAEEWALETGAHAFRQIVSRFDESA